MSEKDQCQKYVKFEVEGGKRLKKYRLAAERLCVPTAAARSASALKTNEIRPERDAGTKPSAETSLPPYKALVEAASNP